MKSTIFSTAAVLSLASSGLAQTMKQSKPFQLQLQSADKNLNGKQLGACHEGAAIEGLCVTAAGKPTDYNTYHFNTTSNQVVQNKKLGPTGALTYNLHGGNFVESEPMIFYYDPSTNLALPLFEPTDVPQQVGFDDRNVMHVQSNLDDTTDPPKSVEVRGLYRFYACTTYYTGYTYQTLTWLQGNGKPENPTCKKVEVVRKFI